MAKPHLIASLETFDKGGKLMLPDEAPKAFYVIEGAVRADGSKTSASLSSNGAMFVREPVEFLSRDGATIIRWDLASQPEAAAASLREGADHRKLISAPLDIDLSQRLLMRCDRVEFPPGGVAYLHSHRGPGIRVLLFGRCRIDTAGTSHQYGPLEPWFESGPEPVFAAASDIESTAFARVMVLPAELKGMSSIRYVREEDKDKPKPQLYQVYLDRLL